MKILLHIPLFVVILVIYNLALIAHRDGFRAESPAGTNVEQAAPSVSPPPAPQGVTAPEPPAGTVQIPAPTPGSAQAPAPAPEPSSTTQPATAPEEKTAQPSPASHPLDRVLFTLALPSKATMPVSTHEFLLVLAVIFLYIELFKSTRTSNATIVEHVLSLIVFMAFFVELIVFRPAGTPTFLIMTLLAFLDVIAGFTITISTARRDFGVGAHSTEGA